MRDKRRKRKMKMQKCKNIEGREVKKGKNRGIDHMLQWPQEIYENIVITWG